MLVLVACNCVIYRYLFIFPDGLGELATAGIYTGGGVLVIVCLLIVCLLIVFFVHRKHRRKKGRCMMEHLTPPL